ncbi:hypothetical protein CIT292_09829 [Citrobacter youngae ATCC 29220]|uniref:Uncharacterized protein n=1 Tax=Citrobacter youngae ATCC 29220 TaxID=500640 RepID=D4BH22_9ENTR|nr:hypothetical protein CIT292_09829 [Citrobacter youngae ATCC 29220]
MFPAPAGINRLQTNSVTRFKSVPRASGDKPAGLRFSFLSVPCSPRQRG